MWREVYGKRLAQGELSHPRLASLLPLIVRKIAPFKAPSTMVVYTGSFKRLRAFCEDLGAQPVPADPLVTALYLTEVLAAANSFSVVHTASSAICFHDAANVPSPTNNDRVQSVREAAQRTLPGGVNKKEPLELRHLEAICKAYAGPGCSLEDLMVCTAISLAFFGFLRYAAGRLGAHLRLPPGHVPRALQDRSVP